jgi:hypothetical protein
MKRLLPLLFLLGCSSVPLSTEAGTTEPDAPNVVVVDGSADAYSFDAYPDLGWVVEDAGDVGAVSLDSDLPRSYVSNQISVSNNVVIKAGTDYYMGDAILAGDVIQFISGQIGNHLLPYDPDAVYLFLTGYNIDMDTGNFCGVYCGWHDWWDLPWGQVRYAFVGNPEAAWCSQNGNNLCSGFMPGTKTPNGDWAADSMVSVVLHELAETATDPSDPNGWAFNNTGTEVGDVCDWDFGDVYPKDDYIYNVGIGDKLYLTQKLWKRVDGHVDHCALSMDGNPGFVSNRTPILLNEGKDTVGQVYYFGGPVMSKPITVNLIWYGEWHDLAKTQAVLNGLINHLGKSNWWDMVSKGYFSLPEIDAGVKEGGAEAGLDAGIQ